VKPGGLRFAQVKKPCIETLNLSPRSTFVVSGPSIKQLVANMKQTTKVQSKRSSSQEPLPALQGRVSEEDDEYDDEVIAEQLEEDIAIPALAPKNPSSIQSRISL
jgi:hypothetical protein